MRTDLKVAVRPLRLGHLPEVLEIEKVSFPTPWSRQSFEGELEENDFARYYVAMVGGKVRGYAGMWVIIDEAHVTNVAVHPDYRGRGLGRLLMLELMGQAMALGADRITLEVRPANAPAQVLYRHLGFAPAGIRKGYYSDTGEDAIIMWKNLFTEDLALRSGKP